MIILPAIDLYEGKAVRLYQGDYSKMTVYSDAPWETAARFKEAGAEYLHIVDLEGAKAGRPINLRTVEKIIKTSGLRAELGGGIRSESVIEECISAGVSRVILGTAALKDPDFTRRAAERYKDAVAAGADIRNGMIAHSGWTETSDTGLYKFAEEMQRTGIKTLICTDISRDGAMRGTNRELYAELSRKLDMNIVASGGISSEEDIRALSRLGIYGAILGKALYTGAVDLKEALDAAKTMRSVQ